MKKLIFVFAVLILTLPIFSAGGESIFAEFRNLEWSYCSGASAWSTDMTIREDGSFTGLFHDGEMGEAADEYPYGTIYVNSFTGHLSVIEQISERVFRIHVDELLLDEKTGIESFSDGTRFVTAVPYGLTQGDEMVLYAPGMPILDLPEDLRLWTHVQDLENPPSELETWFLTSIANDSGFLAYPGYVDPWLHLTAEQLSEKTGLSFGVPEDAENISYRYLEDEQLAEMRFTLDSDEFCARMQPASLKPRELLNISDIYYVWENEEAVAVGSCSGTIAQAQADKHDWVELCLWYDPDAGIMYSLSVVTPELNGLDLVAVAEYVYRPVADHQTT